MAGFAIGLKCDSCGGEFSLREALTTCPDCGGLLEVQYDLDAMKRGIKAIGGDPAYDSIWRYRQFFPQIGEGNIITLGEGRTPLVKSVHLARKLGIDKLCYIANPVKKAMIQLYGAQTAILDYDDFGQISSMLEEAVKRLGLYQFVNFINPIRHEAMKTYAYEITEQLGRAPDAMFHPVGTGGGIWGAYKGYRELACLGFTEQIPRMYGVQPEAAAHFKAAFEAGRPEAGAYGDCTKTIAQSIASDSPIQGGAGC